MGLVRLVMFFLVLLRQLACHVNPANPNHQLQTRQCFTNMMMSFSNIKCRESYLPLPARLDDNKSKSKSQISTSLLNKIEQDLGHPES